MKLFMPYNPVSGPDLTYNQKEDLHRGYPVDTIGNLEGGDVFISYFEGDEIIAQCVCSTKNG